MPEENKVQEDSSNKVNEIKNKLQALTETLVAIQGKSTTLIVILSICMSTLILLVALKILDAVQIIRNFYN